MISSVSRMAVAFGGALFLVEYTDLGIDGVFAAIGCAMLVYGLVIAIAIGRGKWRPRRP